MQSGQALIGVDTNQTTDPQPSLIQGSNLPPSLCGRISQQAKRCQNSDLVPHLPQIFVNVARLDSLLPLCSRREEGDVQ